MLLFHNLPKHSPFTSKIQSPQSSSLQCLQFDTHSAFFASEHMPKFDRNTMRLSNFHRVQIHSTYLRFLVYNMRKLKFPKYLREIQRT